MTDSEKNQEVCKNMRGTMIEIGKLETMMKDGLIRNYIINSITVTPLKADFDYSVTFNSQ